MSYPLRQNLQGPCYPTVEMVTLDAGRRTHLLQCHSHSGTASYTRTSLSVGTLLRACSQLSAVALPCTIRMHYPLASQPMRIPVIRHTTHYQNDPDKFPNSYDSAYESKSDSESSNSSIDVGSGGSASPARSPSPARSVRCRWADCGLSFLHLDELAAHVTSLHAHTGPGGLFFCGWEGCSRGQRGFNARYKMLVHVRTHTNEKPHHCFQCDKSFSRAENLKIHARSHTGERPYICPVPGCGKAYSNSSDRFKHTRTHSVDKPYICKIPGCGKRYTDPSSLRKHVKTYRHFRAAPAPDPSKGELQFEEDPEREQIVPETDDYHRFYETTPYPYIADVRGCTWPGTELSHGMQWEHTPLWSQPSWNFPTGVSDHDMPLDLSVHK